jgi:peptidoglycan hydrolase CwlO-like protein
MQVQQLEAQQQQKEKDVQRMRSDIIKAQQQRDQARSDVERFRLEAALAEKALAALNEQVAAARRQLNPLNHPLVRDFYKR